MDIYRILQELCIELPTEKKDEFSAQCQMRGKNLLYALCSVREWNEAMDGSNLKVSRTAISEILASVDRTVGNLNRVIPEEIHVFGYSPDCLLYTSKSDFLVWIQAWRPLGLYNCQSPDASSIGKGFGQ